MIAVGGLKATSLVLGALLYSSTSAIADVSASICADSVLPLVEPALASFFKQDWRTIDQSKPTEFWLPSETTVRMLPFFMLSPNESNIKADWRDQTDNAQDALAGTSKRKPKHRKLAYFAHEPSGAYLRLEFESLDTAGTTIVTCSLVLQENPFKNNPPPIEAVEMAEWTKASGKWALALNLTQMRETVLKSAFLKSGGTIFTFAEGVWQDALDPKFDAAALITASAILSVEDNTVNGTEP